MKVTLEENGSGLNTKAEEAIKGLGTILEVSVDDWTTGDKTKSEGKVDFSSATVQEGNIQVDNSDQTKITITVKGVRVTNEAGATWQVKKTNGSQTAEAVTLQEVVKTDPTYKDTNKAAIGNAVKKELEKVNGAANISEVAVDENSTGNNLKPL